MRYLNSRSILKTFILLSCAVSYIHADKGTTALDFLRIGINPRHMAMGEAGSAIFDGIVAANRNPAALVEMERTELAANYILWLEDTKYQYAAFGKFYKNIGIIGISIFNFDMGNIDGYDESDIPTGSLTAYDRQFMLTVARDVVEGKLSAGANIRIIKERLDDKSVIVPALDLACVWKEPFEFDGFAWGLGIQHLGPAVKFISTSDPLPVNIRTGAAYKFISDNMLAAADINIKAGAGAVLCLGY